MASRRLLGVLGAVTTLAACYHATIETGLTPSTQILEQSFASSWIYGLVPPKTVQTASRCPDGVARVETELSFLNQLVHVLTLGIYTPMHIRVTCAQRAGTGGTPSASLTVPRGADDGAVRSIFSGAAASAAENRRAVLVRFEQ